jgi:hypothetical protein
MVRRKLSQLDTPTIQKRRGRDEYGVRPLATKFFEGQIDFAAGVGIVAACLQSHDASSRLHVL